MSNNSVIEHRANYHHLRVCEEYLLICSKGDASPHCKALILSVLEQWTNTKRDSNQPLDSIYMTYPLWEQALYYLYSKNIIVASLNELLAEKMIARKEHRSPNGKDTYAYELKIDAVQAALKALPDKGTKELLPRLDAFKNAPRKTRSKEDAVKSDRQTQSNLTGNAVKLGRNVSSNITSSQKESVITPTLPQPESTHPLSENPVSRDYTITPSIQDDEASVDPQLSTQQPTNVDNSPPSTQPSHSQKSATRPATHVGKAPVLAIPLPPGDEVETVTPPPSAKPAQVVPPQQPPRLLHTEEALAVSEMYERVAGPSGYAKWDWEAMETMGAKGVTEEDIKLVFAHLESKGMKRNVEQVWLNWWELATLKNPSKQRTRPKGPSDNSYHPELETDETRAARDAKNKAALEKIKRMAAERDAREASELAARRERRAN